MNSSRFTTQEQARFVEWSPRPDKVMRVSVGCRHVKIPVPLRGASLGCDDVAVKFGYEEVALKKVGRVDASTGVRILETRMYGWHRPSRMVIVSEPQRTKLTPQNDGSAWYGRRA